MLSRFDSDLSGDLSFEEYLALMAVWVEEDETQIIEAFKVIYIAIAWKYFENAENDYWSLKRS